MAFVGFGISYTSIDSRAKVTEYLLKQVSVA